MKRFKGSREVGNEKKARYRSQDRPEMEPQVSNSSTQRDNSRKT